MSSGSGAGHCAGANRPGGATGASGPPGLYVRVRNYVRWIKKYASGGACSDSEPSYFDEPSPFYGARAIKPEKSKKKSSKSKSRKSKKKKDKRKKKDRRKKKSKRKSKSSKKKKSKKKGKRKKSGRKKKERINH